MNFKKGTSILLVFLLLISNFGFAFNVHYCGDKVASISFKPETAKAVKACCVIKVEKSNCCKSKVVHFQKKADNTIVKVFAFQSAANILPQVWQQVLFTPIADFKSDCYPSYYCNVHAPPFYQLYSQYLFYEEV